MVDYSEMQFIAELALAIGEDDAIDYIRNINNEEIVANVCLSKSMSPSKEEWEKLGFVFTDIPDDDVLCYAKLPEGWQLRRVEGIWNEMVDSNGLIRAKMWYKTVPDINAHMYLLPYYHICSKYNDDETKEEIWFGNDNEKLYIAGVVDIKKDWNIEDACKEVAERDKLSAFSKIFGDKNYPGWESTYDCWNKEVENIKSIAG